MAYLGSWKIDDYVTFYANTHDPSDGSASDADSAPTYRVYEDETGAAILTGTMALLDDANTTGFYSERIQCTAANGFEKGKQYVVYVSATIGGTTATKHDTWQIEAEVDTNTISDTSTEVQADVAKLGGSAVQQASGYIKVSAGTGTGQLDLTSGRPGIDWAKVSNPTSTVGLSNTTVGTCAANSDMRGTDGAFLAASAPANFSDLAITVTTGRVDVASIEGSDATNQIRDAVVSDSTRIDAGNLNTLSGHDPGATIGTGTSTLTQADILSDATPIDGANLNTLSGHDPGSALAAASDVAGLNDLSSADAQSACTASLNAYDPPTKTEMDSGLAGLNDLSSADVQTACGSALTSYDPPTKTEMDSAFTEIKGATWAAGTDTLEAIRDRGDSAWVTATSVTVSDKTGFSLASDQSGVTIGTVTTNTDMRGTDNAALAATALSTANWTNTRAGYLDALNGHTAQTGDSYTRLGAPAGASVSADIAAVKSDAAAVLDDTGTAGVVVAAASKSGYSLAATGLDAVSAPSDLANDTAARATFVGMIRALFNRFYNNVTQTSSQQIVHNDSGTAISTMACADDGTTQSKAKSS